MSALPPRATAKADLRKEFQQRRQKQIPRKCKVMSALHPKADIASIEFSKAPAPDPKGEADESRRHGAGRLDAYNDIAGNLGNAANAAALADSNLTCRETGGRNPHQHFQVPA